ncbi:uncharacterized protein LOC144333799 [Macaca mulatta]
MDVGSPFRPWPTYDPFSLKVRTTGNFHKMGPRSLAAIALPRGAAAEDRRASRDQSERDDATGGRAGPRGRVLLQASGLFCLLQQPGQQRRRPGCGWPRSRSREATFLLLLLTQARRLAEQLPSLRNPTCIQVIKKLYCSHKACLVVSSHGCV